MQPHQEKKISQLLKRFIELEEALSRPDVAQDMKAYRALTQEHAYLSEVKQVYESYQKAEQQFQDNKELLKSEKDEEFLEILRQDCAQLEPEIGRLTSRLENLLIPPDPKDHANTILEIRAGTGGEEAALFVADCVRMYKLFADKMGWKYERLSATESDLGGFKEYVMVMSGSNVYRMLKHEAGTHRVQRVPETEAQGRVHTSAITVAVLLEPGEDEDIKLEEKDLRFDTYRSSGAGGQHVNTTDSAVRVTHIPTGVVTYCQEEKSQHKNKEKALRLLKAKLVEIEREKKKQAIDSTRAMQVGSGDRSERIRTYNFPQNRLTDHRINLTKYNLDQIMDGELEDIATMLVAHYYQQQIEQDLLQEL